MKKHLVKVLGWMRLHTLALAIVLLLTAVLTPVQRKAVAEYVRSHRHMHP